MRQPLVLPFLAPIPVGHRVQMIRASRWQSPLFGGQPSWNEVADPVVVDRDTGIIYASSQLGRHLVLEPLGFKPNTGHQVASLTEGRVTSCLVTMSGGDTTELETILAIEIDPQGYRQ